MLSCELTQGSEKSKQKLRRANSVQRKLMIRNAHTVVALGKNQFDFFSFLTDRFNQIEREHQWQN